MLADSHSVNKEGPSGSSNGNQAGICLGSFDNDSIALSNCFNIDCAGACITTPSFLLINIWGSIEPSSDLSSINKSFPAQQIMVAALLAICGIMNLILVNLERNNVTILSAASSE